MSELEEARDAAQMFFEASVVRFADLTRRAIYVSEILQKWPWLRPNPYQAMNVVPRDQPR